MKKINKKKTTKKVIISRAERLRNLRLAEAKEVRLSKQATTKAMQTLVHILKESGHVSPKVITSLEISIVEVTTGKCLTQYHPTIGFNY